METVTIACAVPRGSIIGADAFNKPIRLSGPNASGVNYGTNDAWGLTALDAAAWNSWLAAYGSLRSSAR
jgi:hypothetical protein